MKCLETDLFKKSSFRYINIGESGDVCVLGGGGQLAFDNLNICHNIKIKIYTFNIIIEEPFWRNIKSYAF